MQSLSEEGADLLAHDTLLRTLDMAKKQLEAASKVSNGRLNASLPPLPVEEDGCVAPIAHIARSPDRQALASTSDTESSSGQRTPSSSASFNTPAIHALPPGSLQAARLALQLQALQLQKELLLDSEVSSTLFPSTSAQDAQPSTLLSPTPFPLKPTSPLSSTSGPPPSIPLPPIPNPLSFAASAPSTPTLPTNTRRLADPDSVPVVINNSPNVSQIRIDKTALLSALPADHAKLQFLDNAENRADSSMPPRKRSRSVPQRPPPPIPVEPVPRAPPPPQPTEDPVPSFFSPLSPLSPPQVHFADLASWASPDAQRTQLIPIEEEEEGIRNLPSWKDIEAGSPTSLPIWNIQRDLDYSLRRLMNMQMFEALLNDPLGRHRFRHFIISTGGATASLDMWVDVANHTHLISQLRQSAEALNEIYLASNSQYHVKLPPAVHRDVELTLRRNLGKPHLPSAGLTSTDPTDLAFESIQHHLLESLYNSEFQSFIKHRIIEQTQVKLGRHSLTNSDGLGDCFCLTNPRLKDHPIVLVSDGFNAVTGYPRSQIVGRNCRFLQGPGTAPESIQRIRAALNAGEGCTELLLNYRSKGRDGSPFYCLLCIVPLRDSNGELVYYIGGQTNVTGVFAENKDLSFLISGASHELPSVPLGTPVSPAMSEYLSAVSLHRPEGAVFPTPSGIPTRSNFSALNAGSNTDVVNSHGTFPPSAMNNSQKIGGVMNRVFKKRFSEPDFTGSGNKAHVRGDKSPLLGLGAESTFGSTAKSIITQFEAFNMLYSKLIIFKKAKREIIFITRDLLAHLDLPTSTYKDLYASPLVHSDLLECLSLNDKAVLKLTRLKMKRAIKDDESMSVEVGLKLPGWGLFSGRNESSLRTGILHMTPLKERDGQCVAFVCVFA